MMRTLMTKLSSRATPTTADDEAGDRNDCDSASMGRQGDAYNAFLYRAMHRPRHLRTFAHRAVSLGLTRGRPLRRSPVAELVQAVEHLHHDVYAMPPSDRLAYLSDPRFVDASHLEEILRLGRHMNPDDDAYYFCSQAAARHPDSSPRILEWLLTDELFHYQAWKWQAEVSTLSSLAAHPHFAFDTLVRLALDPSPLDEHVWRRFHVEPRTYIPELVREVILGSLLDDFAQYLEVHRPDLAGLPAEWALGLMQVRQSA